MPSSYSTIVRFWSSATSRSLAKPTDPTLTVWEILVPEPQEKVKGHIVSESKLSKDSVIQTSLWVEILLQGYENYEKLNW